MAITLPEAYFVSLALEMLFYGMYTCLFAGSLYLMVFKRKKTKVIIVMIILNTIMWALATSHMAVSFQQNFHAFLREHGADRSEVFEDNASPSIYSQLSLESINFVIGDGVVIWRVWVLWNRKRWILVISATLLLTTFVGAIGVVRSFATAPQGVSVFDNRSLTAWGLAFIASTLTTNIWATTLIAYRTWSHNRLIRSITGEAFMVRLGRQNGILAILIESGILYSCSWFVAIVIIICGNNGVYVVIDMLSQLTAIYPTLIMTLVCLKSTLDVAMETFRQTTQSGQPTQWAVRANPDASLTNGTISSYPMRSLPVKIGVKTTTHTDSQEYESGNSVGGYTVDENLKPQRWLDDKVHAV
ncbi:uncharacterized protein EV420DRAFT_1634512 [Desarmillaria tabescens]|uniref:Uncharacterized protein n=1 Tax=Armillaria tabescens TaxID=1929756 RepID=A0AA39TYJ2_ARMTA|nr:uncharacterized protein EV420DRAFT_1634512 [Desarmillaria tabescens]KAK0470083.1 hypothetical protein EV420DRAFT_1634512 [Desarmillaria tabescens]